MRKTFLPASILFAARSIIVHVLLYIEVSTLITYLYYICTYILYSLKMLYSMDLYFERCTLFLSLLHCAAVAYNVCARNEKGDKFKHLCIAAIGNEAKRLYRA